MTPVTYADVTRDVLSTLERPKPAYFLVPIGFATLTNNFNFGLLTGLALLFALLADFFLAPAMLVLVFRTRYGREVAFRWGSSGSGAALAGGN